MAESIADLRGNKVKIWITEIRAPFFTATVVPILLGAVIAWARADTFHWGYFLLTMAGGLLLHIGANVANDYFDHLSGADEMNVEFVRPFTGGSRMIQEGLLTPKAVLTGALAALALADHNLGDHRCLFRLLLHRPSGEPSQQRHRGVLHRSELRLADDFGLVLCASWFSGLGACRRLHPCRPADNCDPVHK
jgi:hypothetical protein